MPEAATRTDNPAERGRFPLHLQMLAGFAIGLAAGLAVNLLAGGAPWVDTVTTYVTGPIGQVFLRLLFMLVLPLLFAALVTGVAEMGDLAALKRVGAADAGLHLRPVGHLGRARPRRRST